MKVLFLEDVEGVAQGGEIKEVKRGFARNYLIPKSLATPATRDALQRIDRLTKQAEGQRIKKIADMKTLAEELRGRRVDIEMRAGATGRLYGSVTNGIVADGLSEMMDREIERRNVQIPESIRDVGMFEVRVHLYADINASVSVLVHPMDTEPDEFLTSWKERQAQAEGKAEDQDSGDEDGAASVVDEQTPVEAEDEPVSDSEGEAESEST